MKTCDAKHESASSVCLVTWGYSLW